MKKFSFITIVSSSLMVTATGLSAQDGVSVQPTIATSITYAEDMDSSIPSSSWGAGDIKPSNLTSQPTPSVASQTSLDMATTQPEFSQLQLQTTPSAMKENTSLAAAVTTRSIRSKESGEAHSRISIVQNGARGTAYDPLNPYRVERYETQLVYEYFPRPDISVGLIPVFMKAHYAYKLDPTTDHTNGVGIVPFANYLFTPNWLGTVQGGYYYDNHSWLYPQFDGGSPNVTLRQQAHKFFGALYVTWMGPHKCISGSVRAGALYEFEHFKAATDSIGELQPGRNFERGGVSLSGRLKYAPADKWELYFQTEFGYSLKVTRRPTDFKTGGGRQRLRFLAGPGVHYNISPGSELAFNYFFVQGYGFYRENQISLRFRLLL